MDMGQKVEFVHECLAGEESIPVQLRMNRGFDEERFTRLVAVLEELVEECREEESVPKRLAFACVDIRTAFEASAGLYPEAAQERIEDAAEQLVDLAYQLFSADE